MAEAQKVEFRFRQKDGYKRPTVEVDVPMPTAGEIIEILQEDGGKTKAAVVDAVNGLIVTFLRGKVNDDEDFGQENVDKLVSEGQLTLQAIANLPRSERNTITIADLAAFGQAFVDVAVEVENDPDRKITSEKGARTAATVFADRLRTVVGKNDILDTLQVFIEKFVDLASEELVQEHQAVVEWLFTKIEEAKKRDEISLDALE